MSNITVNKLTNCNVYLDGEGFMGKAEEASLPVLKQKMTPHKGLGMIGEIELPAGFEKLEAKFKWSSLFQSVAIKAADPHTAVAIQIRGSLETFTGQGRVAQVPVVIHMRGTFKDFPLGNFKHLDPVELETNMAVTYIKQTINGQDVIELDVLANVYKVGGIDQLATYNRNVGG